jgi:hypothetical protein
MIITNQMNDLAATRAFRQRDCLIVTRVKGAFVNLNRTFVRTALYGLAVITLAASAKAATINGSAWVVPDAPSTGGCESNPSSCAGTAGDASIASLAGLGTADVTFTLNSLNLSSNGSTDYTFGSFIGSGGAGTVTSGPTYLGGSGVSGSTSMGATVNPTNEFLGGFYDPASLGDCSTPQTGIGFWGYPTYSSQACGALFEFTGTATFTHNELLSVTSDDGATLVVNGQTVISDPGPESSETNTGTYTGSGGTFAYTLVYGECCGAPADVSTNFLNSTGSSQGAVPEPSSVVLLATLVFGVGLALRRKLARQS